MDFDSLAAGRSMAVPVGVIVLDDSRDMVWVLTTSTSFMRTIVRPVHALPGRSLWMKKITERMLNGGGVTEMIRAFEIRSAIISWADHLRVRRSVRLADPKFRRKIFRKNLRPMRANQSTAMPPEDTPRELVARETIPTVPRPRSRLGKKPRRRSDLVLTLSHAPALLYSGE